jgi:hypothetical protein
VTLKRSVTLLALLALAAGCAAAAQTPTWRRIAALEDVSAITCARDQSLSWMVRSRQELRELYSPEFHKRCPSGTRQQLIWPCCGEDGYQVIHSRAQLEEILDAQAARPMVTPLNPEIRRAYRRHVDRAGPDFGREALVLFAVPYGATGNARAFLNATEREDILEVRVRIEVPPPPLTPNTVTFFFALAVDKSRIREVELHTGRPAVPDLGIRSSTSGAQRISIRQ